MPAYTSPDNIQYPVSSDQVAPLETVFANLAQSTQNALTSVSSQLQIHTFRWANAVERAAQTGMQAGDTGYQVDTATEYIYTGSAWRLNTGGLILINRTELTAVTAMNLDGVFSPGFRVYKILIDGIGSTVMALTGNLRAGGTNAATGYDLQANNSNGGSATPSSANLLNLSYWPLSSATTTNHSGEVVLFRPAEPAATQGFLTWFSTPNPAAATALTRLDTRGLQHRTASAYDGFGISVSSGTFTGSISVYGMA